MSLFSSKSSVEEKPLVLVVEDNELQSELITKLINETGLYRALTAYNGYDAFEILSMHQRGFDFLSNKITCILLDWQMPKMHGEKFLKLLRDKENRSPFKRHIPVVIISAYDDLERRRIAEDPELGLASAYLQKPFSEDQLLNILKRIVINKEAEVLRELLVEQRSREAHEFKKP
jgi:CheY-like chemotaxis protein